LTRVEGDGDLSKEEKDLKKSRQGFWSVPARKERERATPPGPLRGRPCRETRNRWRVCGKRRRELETKKKKLPTTKKNGGMDWAESGPSKSEWGN